MSNLIVRSALRSAKNSTRAFSASAVQNKDRKMSDPTFHATGLEKYELLSAQSGNDDPFFLRAKHIGQHGKGTTDDPHIVEAMDEYRMVGCVCTEHETNVKWMWLFENKPKRCGCGYTFKLKRYPAPEKFQMPN